MRVKRSFIVILLLTGVVGTVSADVPQVEESIDLKALYEQIDEAISLSPQYVAGREREIEVCRNSLMAEKNAEKRIRMAEDLFLLYQPYKNDSALHYAELCISLADSLRRPDLEGRFRSMMAYQCSNSGMYTESLEQLHLVKKSALDLKGLCEYYNARMHVYGELGSYTQRQNVQLNYYGMQDHYRDSVLMAAEEGSEEWLHLKMDILNARRLYQDALDISDEWLKKVSDNTHESAYAAFYRSVVYDKLKNHDLVCYWLGKSALDDIRCAVMNQASLLFLAEHLADDGDTERACRYVKFAKECNLFFCPLLRNYQVNSVVNVYEKSNQTVQTRVKQVLIVSGVIILILLMLLIILVIRKK